MTSLSHLPPEIRRAIEITPAAERAAVRAAIVDDLKHFHQRGPVTVPQPAP
ncbi:hypothetical protein [Micromonospora sp. NBS 11-29]|uniref:hypothetical protein n=1 Tax=Micromonospora sp. NBS 11-29 TaxID=1960879 RepID=UPI0015940006|nr:hypothetical protein [Micromonospora sp. NBS 11-29]